MQKSVYLYVAVAIMLGLYLLPWVVNPGASLSLGGYDLAEWASLHPLVRAETPMLLTPLLLRLPLVCLALLIAFTTRRGVIPALVVTVIAVGLLPPPEFVRATDDPNYRQQAALALLTLVGGAVGLSGIFSRARRWIAVGIALVGAAASVIGLAQGNDLMRGFNLPTQIGMGGAALALAFVIAAGALAANNQTGQR